MLKIYRISLMVCFGFFNSLFIYYFPYHFFFSSIGIEINYWISSFYILIVSFILILYFLTSITFYPIKLFVYSGLVIGFYGLIYSLVSIILNYFFKFDITVLMPVFLTIVVGYGILNARKIKPKTIEISSKKIKKCMRLGFISDVHLGSQSLDHLNRIIDIINTSNVDALLIGGDLIDSSSFDLSLLDSFSSLSIPIFYVTGNHEFYLKDSLAKINALSEYNILKIDNSTHFFNDIELIGLGDNQSKHDQLKFMDSITSSSAFRILLVHKPWLWPNIHHKIDLMLSGHTHGGQLYPFHWLVRLQFPFYYGFYTHEQSYAYVSSGVGCWGPNARVGSSNEIVILSLKND